MNLPPDAFTGREQGDTLLVRREVRLLKTRSIVRTIHPSIVV